MKPGEEQADETSTQSIPAHISSSGQDDDDYHSSAKLTEEVPADVQEGLEPGASHENALFAADSYEDISSEVAVKRIDGECSSRTRSFSSSSSASPSKSSEAITRQRSTASIGSDLGENDEDLDESEEVQEEMSNLVVEDADDETIDEVRKTRARTVMKNPRDDGSFEDVDDPAWAAHSKHVFILSEAGKPIYSRYGSEEKLVTLMGVMQALVSFVQDKNDSMRCLIAGKHKVTFLVRRPIILVAVCSTKESYSQMIVQLTYVYHQVLSVLTFTQLNRIFEQRRNYDLRKLLSGTEKFIDNLLNMMSKDPSFSLGSVRCLPLASQVRDSISQAFQQAKSKDLVFAILVASNQLVTMVRPKNFSLHPSDLHLIFNLVSASTAFQTVESWTPICLPRFDNSGYLYAHVSYLSDDCPACLLLLSTDRDAFFSLAECRTKIEEKLRKNNCLEAITRAAKRDTYTIDQVGIPELWHFIYKSRSTAQFTSPEVGTPYNSSMEQDRLFNQYLFMHHRIHSSSRPLKLLCHVGKKDMMIGWITSGFELYASFSPLTSKANAMAAVNKLLRWIKGPYFYDIIHKIVFPTEWYNHKLMDPLRMLSNKIAKQLKIET